MAQRHGAEVSAGDGRPKLISDMRNCGLDGFARHIAARYAFAVSDGSVFSRHAYDDRIRKGAHRGAVPEGFNKGNAQTEDRGPVDSHRLSINFGRETSLFAK